MPLGPLKGEKIDRDAFNDMLDEYYRLHHWDTNTGSPSEDAVKYMGLDTS